MYGRKPDTIDDKVVLGFLLKERDEKLPPSGPEIKFVPNGKSSELRAREWYIDTQAPRDLSSGILKQVLAYFLTPFALLGRFAALFSSLRAERGRWPKPRSRFTRNLVDSINGALGGLRNIWGMTVVLLLIIIVFIVVVGIFIYSVHLVWNAPWLYPFWLIIIPLLVISLALVALICYGNFLVVLVNLLFLRATRRILYGLMTTYVAGPGAPAWVERQKNIIALPIPPAITTLSFKMPPEERQRMITAAREVTLQKLNKILSSETGDVRFQTAN
jgi:phage shock protein PspC (stress-responsive transcriptional regulator)